MSQFTPNEVADFLVGLVTLVLIAFVFARSRSAKIQPFFAGFAFMLAASVFTLVEEVFAEQLFNSLEHLSFTLAAWSFFFACRRLGRSTGGV